MRDSIHNFGARPALPRTSACLIWSDWENGHFPGSVTRFSPVLEDLRRRLLADNSLRSPSRARSPPAQRSPRKHFVALVPASWQLASCTSAVLSKSL
jgi:hypothetical protein